MARKKDKHSDLQEERIGLSPLRAQTPKQGEYINAIKTSPQVISLGPAGTGKSYIAAILAADALRSKEIEQIILTRPNVSCGKSLGFFPGSLIEKFEPWAAQFLNDMQERLGKGPFDYAIRNRKIEGVPFEVMRGRSWKDSFIILDEAQNSTRQEIQMFLTRIGQGSRVVLNGDVRQSDLKETSGLRIVLSMIRQLDLPVPIIEFGLDDIVRSDICRMWTEAFNNFE